MKHQLRQEIVPEVRQILYEDSLRDEPIVQSISLFFWQTLTNWVHHFSTTPEPFTIALAGASGSGKSYIREILEAELLTLSEISSFTQDNYYRDFEADFPHLSLTSFYDEIDFDDPVHIRFDQLAKDLYRLKKTAYGDTLKIPKLRYGTPDAKPTIIHEGKEIIVNPFIVTEGIFAFYDRSLTHLYDLKIYVDIDERERRERWLDRNTRENRGTTDNMWQTTVACLENYILPSREVADIVINNNVPQPEIEAFLNTTLQHLASIVRRVREAA